MTFAQHVDVDGHFLNVQLPSLEAVWPKCCRNQARRIEVLAEVTRRRSRKGSLGSVGRLREGLRAATIRGRLPTEADLRRRGDQHDSRLPIRYLDGQGRVHDCA